MSDGGAAQPVTPVTDRMVSAAPALRVAVVSDGRPTLGGPSQPVYVVTDNRPTQGNVPVPVVLATGVQASNVMAGPAIPVVVVSGSLSPGSSLLTSLAAYYTLNEASGNRLDSLGVATLTPINTPTQAAGKVGAAVQLASTTKQRLDAASASVLSLSGSFAIDFWFWLDALPTAGIYRGVVGKWNANQFSYVVYADGDLNRLVFEVSGNGTSSTVVVANNFGALSANTWYYGTVWHDSVAQTINISINNGTANSAAHTSGVFASTALFDIGRPDASFGTSSAGHWNGRIDELGVWSRVLTAAERTARYAGGAGTTYPFDRAAGASFFDDFSAGTLSSQWRTDRLFGNNGDQQHEIASDDILVAGDGKALIRAQVRSLNGWSYTAGFMHTFERFSQRYGTWEIRAKFPAGKGFWPALWLCSANRVWPPEIDIVEAKGSLPNNAYLTSHYADGLGDAHSHTTTYTGDSTQADYHVYKLDWRPNRLEWLVDGVSRLVVTADVPDDPMYLILDLSVGGPGSFDGAPDGTTVFPAYVDIDYVRIAPYVGTIPSAPTYPATISSIYVDDFADNATGAIWATHADTGTTIAETGGRVVATPATNGGASLKQAYYRSASAANAGGDSSYVEVSQVASNTATTYLEINDSGRTNAYGMRQAGGTLTLYTRVATVDTVWSTVAYNSTNHRYWRVRNMGGNAAWDVSADGVAWTQLDVRVQPAALENTLAIQSVFLEFGASTAASEATPGSARFERVNT